MRTVTACATPCSTPSRATAMPRSSLKFSVRPWSNPGLGDVLGRIEGSVTHTSDWPARPGAAEDDVIRWWNHVIALHHKDRTLHKELKEAERALWRYAQEENWRWLHDVLERRAALEGAEAEIEQFGALSGRPVRGL